ncbi:proenkephalin-B [Amia ocellicauda]|uniref:proenkephalin-B n=1 Tax=Amia ocellicauda TaxID=2972642 RepID=UPI003463CBBE|nr:PDYN protein [Amia calva]
MEWYVLALVLCLSFPSSVQADCSSQCLACAQQIQDIDTDINSLDCTLECEGALASVRPTELEKCEKALQIFPVGVTEIGKNKVKREAREDQQGLSISNLVKRYGGFIKKVDKNKIFSSSPIRENANLKGLLAKKYVNLLRKFGERDIPETLQDTQLGDETSKNEEVVYNDDNTAINEVKRYGGFLRKFGPKRSYDSVEQSSQEELQKRYGGFMRRIRPKLKWDNQKRYGGFLRRHFKISVRSEKEPSSYPDDGVDL